MLPDILNPLVNALTGLEQTLNGAIQALKTDDHAMRQAEQTLTASGQGFGGFSQVRSGPAIFGMFLGTAADAYTRSVDINLAASDFSLEALMYVQAVTSAAAQNLQPWLTLTRPSLPSLSPT
ncbi:MAG TPA: hypothetical protein VHD63_01755, partial [Ktedonobacteraceae bacterium]|nr:hypothetical protein [Ktedonobacteraceae bacterium]